MRATRGFTQQELETVLPRLAERFGHRNNVTGWDVGYSWSGGKRQETLALRIHVERKIAPQEMESADVFPEQFDGFPLDVIEGPYVPSRTPREFKSGDHFPVLVGGISCGRPGEGAGTIGAIVIEESTGAPCILSNWHVLAGTRARVSDPILQPGAVDRCGGSTEVIAHLGNSFLDRDGDAALAPLSGDRPWMPSILGAKVAPRGMRDPKIGDVLIKCGRSTGHTAAMVDGVGSYAVDYGDARVIVDGFKLAPLSEPGAVAEISSRGDSGSLWFDPGTGAGVGLHFAGETAPGAPAESALACRLTRVAARLGFRMAGLSDVMSVGAMPEQTAARNAGLGPSPAVIRSCASGASSEPRPFPWQFSAGPVPSLFPGHWSSPFPSAPDPRDHARNGWLSSLDDPFDSGFDGFGPEYGSPGEVSLAGEIVPNLRRAMANDGALSIAKRRSAATVSMKAAISEIYSRPWGVPLALAVNDWAPFGSLIVMSDVDFNTDGTFIEAALTIAERFEERGYKVT